MNDTAAIGHNVPPSQIEFAHETAQALSKWMDDHPVIQTEDEAREAKLLVDRARNCRGELSQERVSRSAPYYRKWEEINAEYKQPSSILENVESEIRKRLSAFIAAEEAKRNEEARLAQEAAEAARQAAIAAEASETEAKSDASLGTADVDILSAVQKADNAYQEYLKKERVRQKAQRAQKVRIGGGFKRAASLRNHEELIVENPHEALDALGLTDDIKEAMLKSARAYRKEFGELPNGVTSETTRAL